MWCSLTVLRQLIRVIATVILIVTLQVLVDTFSIMTGKLVIACSTAVLSHLAVVDDTQPVPGSPCPHPPHQLPALGLRAQSVDLVTDIVVIIFIILTSYYCNWSVYGNWRKNEQLVMQTLTKNNYGFNIQNTGEVEAYYIIFALKPEVTVWSVILQTVLLRSPDLRLPHSYWVTHILLISITVPLLSTTLHSIPRLFISFLQGWVNSF